MKNIILSLIFSFLLASTVLIQPTQATMLAVSTPTKTPTRTPTKTPTRTPTRIPTRTPTRTPTRIPTRTPTSSLLSGLPSQLSFGSGGGGGGLTGWQCLGFLSTYKGNFPVAFFGDRLFGADETGTICIVGLEMKGNLQVSLSTESGKKLGSAIYKTGKILFQDSQLTWLGLNQASPVSLDERGEVVLERNKLPIIIAYVRLPADFTHAQLRIDAQTDAANVTGVSKLVAWDKEAAYLYVPTNSINPFSGPPSKISIKAGQQLRIDGINFPENSTLPLGIYRIRSNDKGDLQLTYMGQSDAQGRTSGFVAFDTNDPPGRYSLVAFSDAPAFYELASIIFYANTCPGAPDSNIFIGDKIKGNPSIPGSNNVRSQAGLSSNKTGSLKANQTAVVLSGMQCVDQMVWWKIRTSAGEEGWVSEGKGSEYWLVPTK